MKKENHSFRAFTLIELLVGISIISVLAALLTPAIHRSKHQGRNIACLSQLKQIGLASIAFAGENNGLLPAATMPNTNRFRSPFQAVLQEIGTPKVFICPTDVDRIAGTSLISLDRSNTSYFASYSASMNQPQSIMAGDRNITRDNGLMCGANTFYRTNAFGWWRDMHLSKGNLLLSDGSVHTTTVKEFSTQVSRQPDATFTWFIPNGDMVTTPSTGPAICVF